MRSKHSMISGSSCATRTLVGVDSELEERVGAAVGSEEPAHVHVRVAIGNGGGALQSVVIHRRVDVEGRPDAIVGSTCRGGGEVGEGTRASVGGGDVVPQADRARLGGVIADASRIRRYRQVGEDFIASAVVSQVVVARDRRADALGRRDIKRLHDVPRALRRRALRLVIWLVAISVVAASAVTLCAAAGRALE